MCEWCYSVYCVWIWLLLSLTLDSGLALERVSESECVRECVRERGSAQ